MSEIAISVKSISKNFKLKHRETTLKSRFVGLHKKNNNQVSVQHVLKNVSFDIKKGEFFGIVGRNGSGKSTLLKILAGIYQPTSGSVHIKGRLVPFIELGVGFNPELTGRENVFLNGALLGFSKNEIDKMYTEIVEFAELENFMHQKLKNYSSGMQVRLAFAMAIRADADILLVDEVLAVGDADFQRKCFDYFRQLKKLKKTVVFISHDMDAVREYCDRAILVEKGSILDSGTSEEVAKNYTKLFVEEVHVEQDSSEKKTGKRYGDQKIVISQIKINKKRFISKKDSVIKLTVAIKANQDIEDHVAVGFLVKNSSGEAVIGTNTLIEEIRIETLNKGEVLDVEWTIPNIFGDGKYTIDIAITSVDGTTNHDWWEDCTSFVAYKERSTPYIVSPKVPTKLTYRR